MSGLVAASLVRAAGGRSSSLRFVVLCFFLVVCNGCSCDVSRVSIVELEGSKDWKMVCIAIFTLIRFSKRRKGY